MGLFDGVDAEHAERIKKELTREVRRELTEELTVAVRERVEKDVRAAARREMEREHAERAPSPEDRKAFRAMVREIQVDAHAQASIASETAEAAEVALARSRQLATPASYAMTIAAPFAVTLLASWAGATSPTFYAAVATFALVLLSLVSTTLRRHGKLETTFRRERKVASDFLIIAERAKAYLMVHAERLDSSVELHELMEALRADKERLDRTNHVSATELETARERVRLRFEEADPMSDAAADEEAALEAELGSEGEEADSPLERAARSRL